jgi:DNA-binding GntR family transcriptional regulator
VEFTLAAQGATAEVSGLLQLRRTAPVLVMQRISYIDDVAYETATVHIHPGHSRCIARQD